MKVEIDSGELCELTKRLAELERWQRLSTIPDTYWLKEDGSLYSVHDTSRKIKALGEERDWWRKQAMRRARLLDGEKSIQNKQYLDYVYHNSTSLSVPKLEDDAKAHGYEVPE